MAAERGHRDIVMYLVDEGADVSIDDNDGVSILNYNHCYCDFCFKMYVRQSSQK